MRAAQPPTAPSDTSVGNQPVWDSIFPESVVSARQIDTGYENANEIWDVVTPRGAFVVRIPRADAGKPRHPFWDGLYKLFGLHVYVDIESQAPLAQVIHDRSPLRVPHVRSVDVSGTLIGRPYTIVERLPGKPAQLDLGPGRELIAQDLGAHLGGVHRARFEYWGTFEGHPRFNPREWPSRLADTLAVLAERDHADAAKVRATLSRFQAQARALPVPQHLTLVFPDLRPSQFLEHDGRLTALVDIESMVIGPRELDLVAIEYSLPPQHVGAFRRGYEKYLPLPPLADVRALYRYVYYLIDILAEPDFDRWMNHGIRFPD